MATRPDILTRLRARLHAHPGQLSVDRALIDDLREAVAEIEALRSLETKMREVVVAAGETAYRRGEAQLSLRDIVSDYEIAFGRIDTALDALDRERLVHLARTLAGIAVAS